MRARGGREVEIAPNQLDTEWRAWGNVAVELAKVAGGDVNRTEMIPVFQAIRRWGEELVALREEHSPDVIARALKDRREEYPALAWLDMATKKWTL